MAHLVRCMCGRTWRCDLEHPRRGCWDDERHTPCPDAGCGDHDPPPFNLTKMVFPVLKQVFPGLIAADIVNAQPMTSPLSISDVIDNGMDARYERKR